MGNMQTRKKHHRHSKKRGGALFASAETGEPGFLTAATNKFKGSINEVVASANSLVETQHQTIVDKVAAELENAKNRTKEEANKLLSKANDLVNPPPKTFFGGKKRSHSKRSHSKRSHTKRSHTKKSKRGNSKRSHSKRK